MALSGDEIRDLYGRSAAARERFLALAIRAVPRERLLDEAKRLGLPTDAELGQPSHDELSFAYDLAIYQAPPGRSRAIDRVARQHASLQTEAALVINALTHAWLSVFRVLDRHPEEGLILEDALLGGEVWLVDQGVTELAPPGTVIASRIGRVLGFAITCGVVAELDEPMLANIQAVLQRGEVAADDLVADSRFVRTLWQTGLGFRIGGTRDPG